MIITDCVFEPRRYTGDTVPATFEDISRTKANCIIDGATASRLSSGLWAWTFDGVSNKITIAANAALQFGISDFSWEWWVNVTALVDNAYIFGSARRAVSLNGVAGSVTIEYEGAIPFDTNVGLIEVGVWLAIAIVRSGNDALIYKNGLLFQTVVNGFLNGDNITLEALVVGYNS